MRDKDKIEACVRSQKVNWPLRHWHIISTSMHTFSTGAHSRPLSASYHHRPSFSLPPGAGVETLFAAGTASGGEEGNLTATGTNLDLDQQVKWGGEENTIHVAQLNLIHLAGGVPICWDWFQGLCQENHHCLRTESVLEWRTHHAFQVSFIHTTPSFASHFASSHQP